MQHLALSQHPSLTVLVDDSESFLRSLAFQFGPDQPTVSFTDARAAIDWLRKYCTRRPLGLSAQFDSGQCAVDCDVEALHHACFDATRFHTPSVVVVDYSMPQMNGIEFCEAIRDLPCKRILFTGAADERIAIDAFHRGLIDRYFRKGDVNALSALEAEVRRLESQFFVDRSLVMRELLQVQHMNFVKCPAVTELVARLHSQYGFVEHYVYHDPAGVLMLTADGIPSMLVLQTEDGMEAHLEMACDGGAPPALLNALRERSLLPFFFEGDGMYNVDNAGDWHRFVQPARRLDGQHGRWYWALFRLPPSFLLKPVQPWRDQRARLTSRAGFVAEAA